MLPHLIYQVAAVRQHIGQRHLDVIALQAAALQRCPHRVVLGHGEHAEPATFQRQSAVCGQKEIVDLPVRVGAGVLNGQVHAGDGDPIGGVSAAAVVAGAVADVEELAAVEIQRVSLAGTARPVHRADVVGAGIQRHRAAAFQPCGHGAIEVVVGRAVHHSGDGLIAVNAMPVLNDVIGTRGHSDVCKRRKRRAVFREGAVRILERASRRQNGARRAGAAAEARDRAGGQRDLAAVVHVEQVHFSRPAGEVGGAVRMYIKTKAADIARPRDGQAVLIAVPPHIETADGFPV